MNYNKHKLIFSVLAVMFFSAIIILGCTKDQNSQGGYNINNSLTLFNLDNVKNDKDILPTDTIETMSGVAGKYIPVRGNTGATAGLDKISLQLFTPTDSLLTSKEITQFYRPEYHVFNTELNIPNTQRGKVYKIAVSSYDKNNQEVGKKTFFGKDVMTCDPLPSCIVPNQITIMLETPAATPADDPIYIFGSINGWAARDEAKYKFYKNPDMPNCYCLSIQYPPGYTDWQLTQIFVTRGTWDTQAVSLTGGDASWDYTSTERGSIWKIKVDKWRDK